MFRTIHVEIDTESWNGQVPSKLAELEGPFDLDILELMATIARVTAPVGGYGFELSTLWPSLRYIPALGGGPDLRLRPEWSQLDSHQKTILSDDFGMGIPAMLVKRAFGADVFATQYAMKRLLPQFAHVQIAAIAPKKRGLNKSPDFLALDPQTGSIHVLECKGTQSSRRKMMGAMTDPGLSQKKAIRIVGTAVGECLVGGVFLPEAHNLTQPVCRFADPEPGVTLRGSRDDFDHIAIDFEIAGALHLMDAPVDIESVAGGAPLTSLPDRIASRRGEWSTEKCDGDEFQVASRTLVFPQERVEGDVPMRGVRMQIGIAVQALTKLQAAPANAPLPACTENLLRRARVAHRSERRFEEVTRGGVFVSVELLMS